MRMRQDEIVIAKLTHGPSSGYCAIVKQAIKHGAVIANITYTNGQFNTESHRTTRLTLVLLFDKISHVARRDFAEKLNIIVGMKLRHLALRRRLGALSQQSQQASIRSVWEQGPTATSVGTSRRLAHSQISPSSCRARSSLPENGTYGSGWASC